MARLSAVLLISAVAGVAAATAVSDTGEPAATVTVVTTRTVVDRYQGRSAREWQHRYRRRTRQLQGARDGAVHLRRSLLHRPEVAEAINLSCATYGYCSTLWRKARCETGNRLSSRAYNSASGAAGLFQFLGSTWNSTPYRVFSRYSPYAAALAAGWMHEQGRGGEWACQ